jgi:hypothetical protein
VQSVVQRHHAQWENGIYCPGTQIKLQFALSKQHLRYKNRATKHIEKRTCSAIINQKVAKEFSEGKKGNKSLFAQ